MKNLQIFEFNDSKWTKTISVVASLICGRHKIIKIQITRDVIYERSLKAEIQLICCKEEEGKQKKSRSEFLFFCFQPPSMSQKATKGVFFFTRETKWIGWFTRTENPLKGLIKDLFPFSTSMANKTSVKFAFFLNKFTSIFYIFMSLRQWFPTRVPFEAAKGSAIYHILKNIALLFSFRAVANN